MQSNLQKNDIISYFKNYCDILDCVFIIEKKSKKSQVFGYITLSNIEKINENLLSQPHIIKGIEIKCHENFPEISKKKIKRKSHNNLKINFNNHLFQNKKIYIEGLPSQVNKNDLINAFQRYGDIENCVIYSNEYNNKKGSFIVFKSSLSVDFCMRDSINHFIMGKLVECKRASNKENYKKKYFAKSYYPIYKNDFNKYKEKMKLDNHMRSLITHKDLNQSFYPDESNYKKVNLFFYKKDDIYHNLNSISEQENKNLINEITNNTYQNLKNNFIQNKFNINHKTLKENYFIKKSLIQKIKGFIHNYNKDKIKNHNENINNIDNNSNSNQNKDIFQNYFNNSLKNPKEYNNFNYKLFDIHGEEISNLSPYQNITRIKLFTTEDKTINKNEKKSYSISKSNIRSYSENKYSSFYYNYYNNSDLNSVSSKFSSFDDKNIDSLENKSVSYNYSSIYKDNILNNNNISQKSCYYIINIKNSSNKHFFVNNKLSKSFDNIIYLE